MAARRWLGYALLACLLLGGRALRRAVLLGPAEEWRDPLWLESVLPTPVPAAADTAPPPPMGPFDVNTVSADTLVHLPGIGPALAGRIVAERVAGGPFRDLEDLQRVRGIGPKLAAKLKGEVIFGPLGTQPAAAAADTCAEGTVPTGTPSASSREDPP
ncbi:MAG TPA: helix-hairpin-helix domain-containing protein [Candidatus Krumholzibacteria bacterium]|nr:helix-hairpin-helix domain-containing protein [Candidatus Krumholzibacteria bacterium]HRX50671.1 helix-hairpin-helix domain-containing protein [Candidatus Krumholzibacteria bacterium]